MRRVFHHLTLSARLKLEAMYRAGYKPRAIADVLRVHVSTIYRELKRGAYTRIMRGFVMDTQYSPEIAHKKYKENLAAKGPAYKIGSDIAYANYLERKMLQEKASPAAALAMARNDLKHNFKTSVSINTVYSYVEKGLFLQLTNKDLPIRGKRKRHYRHLRQARAVKGDSIEYRPEEVNARSGLGHWEMDSVVGRVSTRPTLLVLTERKTRKEIICHMAGHTMADVVAALDGIERRYGAALFRRVFRTITVDNGCEFQDCAGMERSVSGKGKRTKIYYCHPYSAWERGANEKQNQLIRRHFPKGTDFSDVTPDDVQHVEDWLNNYPRAIFGWRSAEQEYQAQLAQLAT